MGISINAQKLKCKEKIFDQTAEHVEESDLIVPDYLPDVAKVVDVKSCVYIKNEEVSTDSITISCDIVHTILYMPEKSCCMKSIINRGTFKHTFDAKGVHVGDSVVSKIKIERCDCKMVNTRKLSVKCVCCIDAKVYAAREIIMPCGIQEPRKSIEIKKRPISMYRVCDIGSKTFDIEDSLALPTSKEPIAELLKTEVALHLRDVKVVKGKAIVKGDAMVELLYLTNLETGDMGHMEYEIPFSQIVDVQNAPEDARMEVFLELITQGVKLYDDSDAEQRILNIELEIKASAIASCMGHYDVISDAYSTKNKLELEEYELMTEHLVDEIESQVTIKDVLQAQSGAKEIGTIIGVRGNSIVSNITGEENKVIVAGIVDVTALYGSSKDEKEYFSMKKSLPLHFNKETKERLEGCQFEVSIEVSNISYNINMSCELEVRVVCNVKIRITKKQKERMIGKIGETDAPLRKGKKPSTVLYYKKEDESIWDIAKGYGVRIGDLVEANEAANEGDLSGVSMLLIP